jgi:hypothetical protein
MSESAKEFEEFARDCVRLAEQADSPELRENQLGARVDARRHGHRGRWRKNAK